VAAKWPVLRFVLLLGAGLGLFYAGYALYSASGYFESWLELTAAASGAGLSALGYEANVNGTIVAGSGFAFRVVRGCDGLEPIGFLLAASLATPAVWSRRLSFALVGAVFLLAMNLARLVSLAIVDVYFPWLTAAAHWNAWPAVTVVVVVVLWVFWASRTQWTDRKIGSTG
jgi:exosortase/archaeosortase family protein